MTCTCESCAKCKRRAYMNSYYRRDPQRIRDIANASRARRLEAVREYDRKRARRATDPMKQKARTKVMHALEDGLLERAPCAVGEDCRGRLEAHHEDYARPLDVVWLCQRHHAERHRRIGVAA